MIRAVLDTNTLVSALSFGGSPREVLELARENKIMMIASPFIFDELRGVLKNKLKRPPIQIEDIIAELSLFAAIVNPSAIVSVFPKHNADNRILECALEGKAEFIITGDHGFLRLRQHKEIAILSAPRFLDTIKGL